MLRYRLSAPPEEDNSLPNIRDFSVGDFAQIARFAVLKDDSVDRRRVPRVPIAFAELIVALPLEVRLVDISVSGVLLRSKHQVEIGTRGKLRFNLAGQPFAADVEVVRLTAVVGPGAERFSIGASFVALGPEGRAAIERFIKL